MYLIAGLGNPGKEYENTRHNLGFAAATRIAESLSITEFKHKKKCDSLVAEAPYSGHKIILAMPQTYMNNSGRAVLSILCWHKIELSHLIVIYDDLDLEPGSLRIRMGGSSAGHKGVESIIRELGTSEFMRVRIGIGRDNFIEDAKEYVLQKVPNEQEEIIAVAVKTAAEAALSIVSSGLEPAMNKFNK